MKHTELYNPVVTVPSAELILYNIFIHGQGEYFYFFHFFLNYINKKFNLL